MYAPRRSGTAARPPGRHRPAFPAYPGRGRVQRGPAVRLVGRRTRRGRLPDVVMPYSAKVLAGLREGAEAGAGVPRIHSASQPLVLLRAMGRPGPTPVVGVDGVPARTGTEADRPWSIGAGQPRPGGPLPDRTGSPAGPARVLAEGAPPPAMSSTWATACCRRRPGRVTRPGRPGARGIGPRSAVTRGHPHWPPAGMTWRVFDRVRKRVAGHRPRHSRPRGRGAPARAPPPAPRSSSTSSPAPRRQGCAPARLGAWRPERGADRS